MRRLPTGALSIDVLLSVGLRLEDILGAGHCLSEVGKLFTFREDLRPFKRVEVRTVFGITACEKGRGFVDRMIFHFLLVYASYVCVSDICEAETLAITIY